MISGNTSNYKLDQWFLTWGSWNLRGMSIVEADVSQKRIKNMEDLEEPQKKDIDPAGELKIPINSPPPRRPFTCEICCSSFKKKHHLKSHLAVHSKVKPFKCPKCSKSFSFGYILKRHSKIHTKDSSYRTRPFECHICTKTYKRKQHLKFHMFVHCKAKSFECPQCSKVFSRKDTLDRHIKIHVEKAKEPQQPLFADTKTAIKFSQAREPPEAAKGPLKPPAEDAREPQAVGITDDEFTILEADVSKNRMGIIEPCSIVGNNFGPSIDSKPGMSTHKNGACENADGVVKKSAAAQTEIFKCQICLKPFTRTYIPVHSNKKRFECPQCKKCFCLKSSLTRHSKIHIDPAKVVKKPQKTPSPQGKIASMLEDLKEALKSPAEIVNKPPDSSSSWILPRHADVTDKDFKISVDNSKYLNPAEDVEEPQKKDTNPTRELKMSKNSPLQRRPFTCEICCSSFKKKQHLKNHSAVHSNVKPFKCPKCGKRFSFRYTLKRHDKVHARDASRPQGTQYDVKSFSYCLLQFLPEHVDAFAKQVEGHVDNADHAGSAKEVKEPQDEEHNARPFECQTCTCRFKKRHHLQNHMSIHTNEKPFKCRQCSRTFSRKTSLNRHLKNHPRPVKKARARPRVPDKKARAPTKKTINEDVNRPNHYLPQLLPRYLGALSEQFGLYLDDSYYAKEVKEPQNEDTDLKSKFDP
ncbi:zinc finger protein 808-like [Penaeus indicus]|uniref:zinc finger protein 808-like n=1 Tax=Penaeus indicus TaxID=29960 RepID=UPI00300C0D7F